MIRPNASFNVVAVSSVRRGFTLVELIIAMGIIAVLVGISAAGIRAGLNSARETETRALIALLDGVLQDRIKVYQSNVISSRRGYYSLASRSAEFSDRFSGALGAPLPGAPNTNPVSPTSSAHFVKKSLFASVFPQRFQDLCGFDGRPGSPTADDANGPSATTWADYDYSSAANYRPVDLFELGLGGNLSDDPPTARVIRSAVEELGADVDLSRHDPRTESAELLYLCLTRPILPDLPFVSVDSIPPNRVADTDNDGLPEFVDGFEQPLRFYTFTTGLFRPTEWTWDTGTVRPDVTGAQAALAYSLAGDATGTISPPIVGHVSPGPNPDAKNLFNLDTDDRFGAVRTSDVTDMSTRGGSTFDDPVLASEMGFSLRHRSSTAVVADVPNIPVNLGTLSVPLIVSLGPDEELGLNEPSRAPTASESDAHYSKLRYATPLAAPAAADDNLTNLEGPF